MSLPPYKPVRWTAEQRKRYDAKLATVRARMCDDGRTRRITAAEVARACAQARHPVSCRYLRAVLGGEKRSRPALRLASAAVRAIREGRRRSVPEWL